ncbi:MAG: DUF1932 domain-containing protein [Pseudomonadota bacterium]
MPNVAIIGVGEAGGAILAGWGRVRAASVRAYDIKAVDPDAMAEHYGALGVQACPCASEAVAGADIVLSTVTADQAVAAAREAAAGLLRGAYWCDCNSCAPSSKRKAAAVIEAAGGRYVDVAVMSPIHPKRNLTPLLISGPHARDVEPLLQALPMAPRVVEGGVGAASSIKMIRSVMVKGLEALSAECLLAAVQAGVEEEVLASLERSHPGTDWRAKTAYNMERALTHGARRAAEMEEVAKTLADLGLPSTMARATVGWQRLLAATGLAAGTDDDVRQIAQKVLPEVRRVGPNTHQR